MTELKSTLVIGEEIGRGFFGRVHIGHDGIRDQLAVKVLRQVDGETAERWKLRRDGLLAEGANLEKAKHRNVVGVHYVCEAKDNDAIHLVMEYCDGGSLEKEYLAGPIPASRVQKIAREVCLGLSSLHERGMIHRDIKPGNILIDRSGLAKIGDFGFVTDEVVEGYAVGGGYRDHLAPEFYADRVSSIRTDIWALGVTLYRLLHGHGWYCSSPAPRITVPEGGYADSLEWLPHIGKDWRRLIRAMLNDVAGNRPANAREILRALAQIDPQNNWECAEAGDTTTWARRLKGRRIEVTLLAHSKRIHSWEAVSYPLGSGRKKRLGGNAHIGFRQAEKELREFFG